MSVLIRGMEMPKSDCVVTLKLYGDGRVIITREQRPGLVFTGMNEVAGTAVELPPHGRLGDLDALEGRFTPDEAYYPTEEDRRDYDNGKLSIRDFRGAIKSSPTVIEAEGQDG